jgi:hypothetical protein
LAKQTASIPPALSAAQQAVIEQIAEQIADAIWADFIDDSEQYRVFPDGKTPKGRCT